MGRSDVDPILTTGSIPSRLNWLPCSVLRVDLVPLCRYDIDRCTWIPVVALWLGNSIRLLLSPFAV